MMESPAKERNGLFLFASSICYAIFGAAAFFYSGPIFNIINVIFGVIVGLIFAFISIKLMGIFIRISHRDLGRQYGRKYAWTAVARGMMFMIPFAVLASLATFYLHWTSANLFLSSAIMTAGASAGMEISKLGKPGAKNFIYPAISAFLVSVGWMLSNGPLQLVLGIVKTKLNG